jgi:polyhydroxyalkanoate synthesis regulator phasin
MALPDLVTLLAPTGTDLANHGTNVYRVDNEGLVRVPREAVGPLIHNGGFSMVETETKLADQSGLVRLMYPDAVPGDERTFDGHKPDKDGIIEVPAEKVAVALGSHGLVGEEEGRKAQWNLAAENEKLATENAGLYALAHDRDTAQATVAEEMHRVEDELAARDEQLAAHIARITELEHQVAELEAHVAEFEAHVAELTAPADPLELVAKAKAKG